MPRRLFSHSKSMRSLLLTLVICATSALLLSSTPSRGAPVAVANNHNLNALESRFVETWIGDDCSGDERPTHGGGGGKEHTNGSRAPIDPTADNSNAVTTPDTTNTPAAASNATVALPGLDLPNGLGRLNAADLGNGAIRVTIPFAQAPLGGLRFANPQPLSTLSAGFDPTQPPSSCYQYDVAPRGGGTPSEDCLYMVAYYPRGTTLTAKLPVFMWLPGGSFIGGSATAAGLDASTLAVEQQMIVIVAQYRLGAFGWLQTSNTVDEGADGGKPDGVKVAGNQAARDIEAALRFVHDHLGPTGADLGKITLAGQSSGAQMVRSLLTVPSASSLFQQAILVSDTQDYGAATQASQNKLGDYVMSQLNCTDVACARGKSTDDVLDASYAAYSDVPASDGSFPAGSPWRPTQGAWMPTTAEASPANALNGNKRIILSTISNEAGAAVGSLFARPQPGAQVLSFSYTDAYNFTLATAWDLFFNQDRGQAMMAGSTPYTSMEISGDDGMRTGLELGATDGLWRCPSQHMASALASTTAGNGRVWLAKHQQGYTYPSNADIDYCTQDDNKRCHEDDIYLIFGTLPGDANDAQRTASKELRARWGQFVRSGTPNPSAYPAWNSVASGGSALNMLQLGSQADGSSTVIQNQRPEACVDLWGKGIKYDWQMYS